MVFSRRYFKESAQCKKIQNIQQQNVLLFLCFCTCKHFAAQIQNPKKYQKQK